MEFKDVLKMLRRELGVAQIELAGALHVNVVTVGRWEQGKSIPNRSTAAVLLDYAKSHEVSAICRDSLFKALNTAVKGRLFQDDGEINNIENSSVAQLKAIFENINGGVSVAVYGDDGAVRLAYANDRYYNLFGYTREQFLSELDNPHMTIHPDDYEYVAAGITRVRETREASTFRYRILKRDGGIAHVRCSSSMSAIDGLGDRVLISVLTDITRDVETEQTALVMGRRLDAIMRNMNSAVTAVTVDDNGAVRFLFTNERFYDMLGYTKAQFDSEIKHPFDLIYPEDAEMVRGAVRSFRGIGESKEIQYRAVCRDKSIKWLRVKISVMSFPDVEAPVQLSIFTDITDIVETSERIAAQRDRIAEMIKETPSGIAVIEADPSDVAGSLRTLYYNDRFFEYSGYTREEYAAATNNFETALVFTEDISALIANIEKVGSGEIGASADTVIRCHTKDGGFRWLLMTGQLVQRRGNMCIINVASVDITERQEAVDRQRINEEMLRIAAETDKRVLIIYDIKKNECRIESRNLYCAKYGEIIGNIPESLIERGISQPDNIGELCGLFDKIKKGEKKIRVSLLLKNHPDKYEWYECNAAVVFDAEGQPDHAVLVLHNITEKRIREAVFKKWQQSIETRPSESYTLYRCNLSKNAMLEEHDGKLLKIELPNTVESFNSRTGRYVDGYVYPDDRKKYESLVNSDSLLAMFYRGEHYAVLEYRETREDGDVAWRRLTIEMVEYVNSTDVQAFLMYEDIDKAKKAELEVRELAETDPLTGTLNRAAFIEKLENSIRENPDTYNAFVMLDMDGFKQLNDTFGHAAGDQALREVSAVMRSYINKNDLVCRLGGDEFVIWLRDVQYDAVICKTVGQICEHIRKAYSQEVLLSASAGIAVYPRDGHSYDELYPHADKALYKVKQTERGTYSFYSAADEEHSGEADKNMPAVKSRKPPLRLKKRRMLIVDDNEMNRTTLSNVFREEFLIETAKNGAEAMIKLRHYGVSISVVMLDLVMPGVDGFEVLRKMQSGADLRTIPVIVVSGDEERSSLLRAIELGAAEYVTKPIDVELVRLRVHTVIIKAENERLRAQNGYLLLQRDEEQKFRTVLESTGTIVVEYDWRNHMFIYDSEISKHIAGSYDHRALWMIFLSDMVAESADVKAMQDMLIALSNLRGKTHDSRLVMLKTPGGAKHWFRMNIYKREDEFGLAEKMIITFNDVHEDVLASEKLKYQATRDALTGLYNRAGFIEKAEELIAAKDEGYYVLSCVDIEKFKVINDQYGTKKGDEILIKFANALEQLYGDEGGVCCRISADNFAVLYPASMIDSSEPVRSHWVLEHIDAVIASVRFAVGRCIVDDKALSISAIYDRAIIAKNTVKGRYDVHIATFDESMRTAILRQQEITGQMNHALKNGQFEVWLQPQYNHTTGALYGAEALVRWRHPTEGIISPAVFIPIFESNGFIYEMDKYVWEQTCILLRRWLNMGLNPLSVSVNISRYDVFRDDLISVIEGLIERYDLPHDLLRLEITESAFSESTDQIINVVEALMAADFTVEIDDFGSGYSSLNTLKDVPAQVLKMDMRFLESSRRDKNEKTAQRGGSIIESVVRMAKWLGMSLIAEGVESVEQADYLKSIGCEYIQGYLYSRPMPASEYEKLFRGEMAKSQPDKLKAAEAWNNNAFWDPRSMETLIFNSYIGGACIFEYHENRAELLRRNAVFDELIGKSVRYKRETAHGDIFSVLDDENSALFRECIDTAISTKKEASCEVELEIAGKKTAMFVHVTMRQIAQTGQRYMMYCVIYDNTERHIAENELEESARQLQFLNDTAHSILAQPDNEKAINETLEDILNYFDGERAYIFEFDYDAQISDNTYEVCAEGVKSEIMRLKAVPIEMQKIWIDAFNDEGYIAIPEISEMDDGGTGIRELLLSQNIRSIIVAPLWRDKALVGYMGIDNPKKTINQVNRLLALADYVAVLLTRRDLTRKIEHDIQATQTLIDDTPGGFVRMAIHIGEKPTIITVNQGMCGMLGMTYDELMEKYGSNARMLFAPVEIEAEAKKISDALDCFGQYSCKCNLVCKDGRLLPVMTFGRFVRGEKGEIFLNSYFTDISEQTAAEDIQKLLLDNLPVGAALYEYDGKAIRVIHINRRYWKLVEREPVDYGNTSVISALHPDDRAVVLQEIESAIRQNRDPKADCRIMCGGGDYKPFHAVGTLSPRDNGCWLLCLTYMPIRDESMAIQELFPIAMSAMMSASDDITYVKDINLRYLCCSDTMARMVGLKSARDVAGKSDYDLFEKKFADRFVAHGQKILDTGEAIKQVDENLPVKDGKLRLLSSSTFPIRQPSGKIVGLYGVTRDITEQTEKESQLEMLTRSVSGGLASYELVDGNIKLVYCNEAYHSALGYTEDEYMANAEHDLLFNVYSEDIPKFNELIAGLTADKENGKITDTTYRCYTKKHELRWMILKMVVYKKDDERYIIYIFQTDITEQQEEKEQLRLAEEAYRIATLHSGHTIGRYDIANDTVTISKNASDRLALPECITDVPYGRVKLGVISKETADDYIDFFERVKRGEPECTATCEKLLPSGWRWITMHATTVSDDYGKPVYAIISYHDVTEQREKDTIYTKWKESLRARPDGSFTLFRCNLNNTDAYEKREGSMLPLDASPENMSFNERTAYFVTHRVHTEDVERVRAFINADTMLAEYYRGHRSDLIEFRYIKNDGSTRWLRLTVELVEYPDSTDIEAFLLFEDIDDEKRWELATIERAETDPLTGILNRVSFAARIERVLAKMPEGSQLALLMMDIDGFKLINDSFGHSAGDRALIETANTLRNVMRSSDLVGRLGGDEFLVGMTDIYSEADVEKRAKLICSKLRKVYSTEVKSSISIGIALMPRDGATFKEAYAKADTALYVVKNAGRDGYKFYDDKMSKREHG